MPTIAKNALKNNEKTRLPHLYGDVEIGIIRIFYYHQLDAKKLKIN